MKGIGWTYSVALHIGIAALAVYGLPGLHKERPTPPPPVAIEFVQIAEQTRQVRPEPVQEQAEEAPQPNYAMQENVAPPPTESVPLPSTKPTPEVKPQPKPKPKKTEQEIQRERLRASVTPNRKPNAPSRLKSKRLAALIDRSIKKETIPTNNTNKPTETKPEPKQVDPFAGLQGRIATASLRDALSQKLASCWNFPVGAKGVADMRVTVRMFLLEDGRLSRMPEYVDAGDMSDSFYRTFAESAMRAVRLCEPFNEASDYIRSGRKYIDFVFDGAEFGG